MPANVKGELIIMLIYAINFSGGFFLTEEAVDITNIINCFENVEVTVFLDWKTAYMHVCQIYAKQRFGSYDPWAPYMMPSLDDLLRNHKPFVDNCQPHFRIKHPRFFAFIAYGMAMALPNSVAQVSHYLMRNNILLMKEFITEEGGQHWLEEQVNVMLNSFGAYIMDVASPIEIPMAGMEIPPLVIRLRSDANQFQMQSTLLMGNSTAAEEKPQHMIFDTLPQLDYNH